MEQYGIHKREPGNPGLVLSSCCWLPSDGASPRLCLPIQSQSDSHRAERLAKHAPFPLSKSEIFLFLLTLLRKESSTTQHIVQLFEFLRQLTQSLAYQVVRYEEMGQSCSGIEYQGFAQKQFLSGEFQSLICDSRKGLHFCLYNAYHIPIAFRHRSNSEMDLIEFIENRDGNVRY